MHDPQGTAVCVTALPEVDQVRVGCGQETTDSASAACARTKHAHAANMRTQHRAHAQVGVGKRHEAGHRILLLASDGLFNELDNHAIQATAWAKYQLIRTRIVAY